MECVRARVAPPAAGLVLVGDLDAPTGVEEGLRDRIVQSLVRHMPAHILPFDAPPRAVGETTIFDRARSSPCERRARPPAPSGLQTVDLSNDKEC